MHGMDAHSAPDRLIAELAGRRHGVVSLEQLLDSGLGRGAIAHRVRTGRLHPIHRGVYAVGHRALSREGRWLAAVLACGDGAVLSHGCAAHLLGLRPSSAAIADVTIDSRAGRRRRAGIRVHRPRVPVHASERTLHEGIPVTSVARTLLDLAELVSHPSLARAVERAEALGLFDLRAVQDTLERHRTRRGAARLRAVLDAYRADVLTRSDLEATLLALCAAHDVAPPATNARVAGHEVDFVWRAQRLIVETDGRLHHATAAAFERDRARDARLTVAGYRVVRFTHRQVTREPAHVVATLHALLGSGPVE